MIEATPADIIFVVLGAVIMVGYQIYAWRYSRKALKFSENTYTTLWHDILISRSSNSILMVQTNRNFMYTSVTLVSLSLALSLLVLAMTTINDSTNEVVTELFVTSFFFSIAFLNFSAAVKFTHDLSWHFISFPGDTCTVASANFARHVHAVTKSLMRRRDVHYTIGQRLFMMGFNFAFLVVAPLAFFISSVIGLFCWYYVDEVLETSMAPYVNPKDDSLPDGQVGPPSRDISGLFETPMPARPELRDRRQGPSNSVVVVDQRVRLDPSSPSRLQLPESESPRRRQVVEEGTDGGRQPTARTARD